jgi:hypothetical protein
MQTKNFTFGKKDYEIIYNDEYSLTFGRNGIYKNVKIVDDKSRIYTYKVQKTQIKAIEGAEGLYKFMSKEIEKNASFCLITAVIDHVIDNIKEYKY